jgi:hypothetical protein
MRAATRLSKGRFDVFAILGPGLLLVSVIILFMSAWIHPMVSATDTLRELSENFEKHWSWSVVLLFLSYLIGSFLRAVPVKLTDRFCARAFGSVARDPYDRKLYKMDFPYLAMLSDQLVALQAHGIGTGTKLPEKFAHTIYNFWKLRLCLRAAPAFAHAQELEARVRLFAGMIWASGATGTLGACGVIASLNASGIHRTWFPIMLGLTLASLICAISLGWRLRRVRGEEVLAVFLGMLNLNEQLAAKAGSGRKRRRGAEDLAPGLKSVSDRTPSTV